MTTTPRPSPDDEAKFYDEVAPLAARLLDAAEHDEAGLSLRAVWLAETLDRWADRGFGVGDVDVMNGGAKARRLYETAAALWVAVRAGDDAIIRGVLSALRGAADALRRGEGEDDDLRSAAGGVGVLASAIVDGLADAGSVPAHLHLQVLDRLRRAEVLLLGAVRVVDRVAAVRCGATTPKRKAVRP